MAMTPEQKKVINTTKKHVLVLAGHGTGKTYLVAHLGLKEAKRFKLKSHGNESVPHVLILTHTTNARDSIEKKIVNIEKNILIRNRIQVRTFHGFALKILNEHGPYKPTVETDAERRILYEIISDGLLGKSPSDKIIVDTLSVYEVHIKSRGSVSKVIEQRFPFLRDKQKIVIKAIKLIKERMKKEGIIPIDKITAVFVNLFNAGKINAAFAHRPSVLIVDEFQDTLEPQWEMVKLIGGKQARVFAIGDPDQAIFTWAGASSKRFDHFKETYRTSVEYRLTMNHRSTKQIVQFCNAIRNQAEKCSGLESEAKCSGNKPRVFCHEKVTVLCAHMIKYVRKLQTKGESLNDMAVIYRFHTDKRILTQYLESSNIPYKVYEKRSRRQRPIIGIIICYPHEWSKTSKLKIQHPMFGATGACFLSRLTALGIKISK